MNDLRDNFRTRLANQKNMKSYVLLQYYQLRLRITFYGKIEYGFVSGKGVNSIVTHIYYTIKLWATVA